MFKPPRPGLKRKWLVTFRRPQDCRRSGLMLYFATGVEGTSLFSTTGNWEEKGTNMHDQIGKAAAAKRRRNNSKAYLSGLGLATMMISPASAASPVTPDSVNPWEHFVDCFKVMLNDSAAHAANCDPGQPGPNSSLTSFSGGASPAPSTDFPFNDFPG